MLLIQIIICIWHDLWRGKELKYVLSENASPRKFYFFFFFGSFTFEMVFFNSYNIYYLSTNICQFLWVINCFRMFIINRLDPEGGRSYFVHVL